MVYSGIPGGSNNIVANLVLGFKFGISIGICSLGRELQNLAQARV